MEIEKSINIDAPFDVVWAAQIDVERWPSFNRNFQSVRVREAGPLQIGSCATIEQPGLPPAVWTVDALESDDGSASFSWGTHVRGMNLWGAHEVTRREGGSELRLVVRASGAPITMFGWALRGRMTRAMVEEAEAFRSYCTTDR